jgi:hypothetical protein
LPSVYGEGRPTPICLRIAAKWMLAVTLARSFVIAVASIVVP